MYRAGTVLFSAYAEAFSREHLSGTPLEEIGWDLVDMNLFKPARFCWGTSVELLLKAIVLRAATPVRPARVRKLLNSHELRKLATEAGLKLSQDEFEVLEMLEEAVKWFGRYRTPRKEEDFDPFYRAEDLASSQQAPVARRIDELYHRLRRELA